MKRLTLTLHQQQTFGSRSRNELAAQHSFAACIEHPELPFPARNSELQEETHDFLAQALHGPSSSSAQDPKAATVLLTHIPLHKPSGLCTDAPYFSHFADGTIKEQNHLSKEMSDYILDGLSGEGKAKRNALR